MHLFYEWRGFKLVQGLADEADRRADDEFLKLLLPAISDGSPDDEEIRGYMQQAVDRVTTAAQ